MTEARTANPVNVESEKIAARSALQDLVRAVGDAYDLLDAAVMNCFCEHMNPEELAAFNATCDAKNRLELICATFDELGTLAPSTREGA